MHTEGTNPGLDRVRFQLRSDGMPAETPNRLRSGIHHRGYLPHVKREGASYFVTFRLDDSLPKEALLSFLGEKAERLRALEIRKRTGFRKVQAGLPQDTSEEIERDYRRKVERYLDQGAGACHLRRPDIADMVGDALGHFDGEQYVLDD